MSGRDTTKTDIFKECKRSAKSYISLQKFIKDSARRRDGIREMISDMESQLIVLKNAEAALSEQINKYSLNMNERK